MICPICSYDPTAEIRENVQRHDNREYHIVVDICKFHNCNDDRIFSGSGAERALYIYCMCYVLGRKQKDVAGYLGMRPANVCRDLKQFILKKSWELYPFLSKY